MNSKVVLSLAIVIAVIIGAAMWFLQTSAPLPRVPDVLNSTPAPVPNMDDMMWGAKQSGARTASEAAKATPPPRKIASNEPPPEWEARINQIIEANPDNSEAANLATAQTLINLLPTLPPEGQAEAAQHLLNLLPDKEYNRVLPIVKNPSTPEEVLDVFVTELMNREDPVKLPALLEIAKIPNHPHQEEAMTDLEIFLDDNFGTNWAKWDAALKTYLKTQADEAASDPAAPAAVR